MGATAAVLEELTASFTRDVSYANPVSWVSLHSANPGATGLHELTAGAGAGGRQQATFGVGSGGVDTSSTDLSFLMAGGGQIVKWIGYWSAQTAGTFLGGYPLIGTPLTATMLTGTTQVVCPGNGLSAHQPVRLFTIPGVTSAVPAGLTTDTIYFVRTVSGNTLTLSATIGGTAITAASSGGFMLALDESATFNTPGLFKITATNLTYETIS